MQAFQAATPPPPFPCSSFGELALLYSAPRAATVRAVQDCKLWVMERLVYTAIKHSYTKQIAKEKKALLDHIPILSVLSPVTIKNKIKKQV
jgi:CRP-like cAMP-binding protein